MATDGFSRNSKLLRFLFSVIAVMESLSVTKIELLYIQDLEGEFLPLSTQYLTLFAFNNSLFV